VCPKPSVLRSGVGICSIEALENLSSRFGTPVHKASALIARLMHETIIQRESLAIRFEIEKIVAYVVVWGIDDSAQEGETTHEITFHRSELMGLLVINTLETELSPFDIMLGYLVEC